MGGESGTGRRGVSQKSLKEGSPSCDLEKQPLLKCAVLGAHLPHLGPYPVSTHRTRNTIQHVIRGFPPTSILQGVPGSQHCADPDPDPDPGLGLELGTLTSNC